MMFCTNPAFVIIQLDNFNFLRQLSINALVLVGRHSEFHAKHVYNVQPNFYLQRMVGFDMDVSCFLIRLMKRAVCTII